MWLLPAILSVHEISAHKPVGGYQLVGNPCITYSTNLKRYFKKIITYLPLVVIIQNYTKYNTKIRKGISYFTSLTPQALLLHAFRGGSQQGQDWHLPKAASSEEVPNWQSPGANPPSVDNSLL